MRQLCPLLALLLSAAFPASGQVAILQIRVVEGEGAVHPPAARSSRAVTVEVTDETGRPIPGAAVSFHLPEDGPGGSFANGLRTDVAVTDARGRAAARAFVANRLPGPFQLRIVASKGQARAGTVSFQYVGGSAATSSAGVKSNRKWIVIAAAAAGGVLAGSMAMRGSTGTPSSPSTPAILTPAPVVLTVGVPTISVGKP